MINYLIVDDEPIAHDIIKGYCDLLPNFELKMNCYDALEALQYLNTHDVDLIFLDLNMPKLKGFDFLKTLSAPPKVIVTTAYSEFALEGFELNVVDYLLKPFSFERFLKAVNKAVSADRARQTVMKEKVVDESRFFVYSDKKYTQVLMDELLYVEASGNYTKLITKNETIITREKISGILTLLPSTDFLQVHKSFAVAVKHIKSIEGNQIRIGDYAIPIGKLYRAVVTQLLK
ncbi:MAG: LytTR family DNA-binding domain-containing protein [Cyclobacteriaceae bacterium]